MLSKKEQKRLYDIEYRKKNKNKIKSKKSKYYYNNIDIIKPKNKKYRDTHKQEHLEYCQTKKYRRYKKNYDEIHRAKVRYGEFWECMIICNKLEKKIRKLIPDKYERLKMRGIIEKNIKKRALKRNLLFGWNYNY